MATRDELYAALRNADKAGDVAGAKKLAAYIQSMPAAKTEKAPDPSEGGGTLQVLNPFGDNFDTGIKIGQGLNRGLAGAGKAFADTGRGISQMLGGTSEAEVQEARDRDRPLMNTLAGKIGNFGGNVSIALPALAIPGAATIPGAAAIGATQGFIQPSVSGNETLANTAIGGAAGVGGVLAARAVSGLYQGAKALAEPFTQAGRQRIAGRTLERFAEDPARIAATTAAPTATGAVPTLAEQTGDAGLARLQDSLRSLDPQIEGQIAGRLAENNAARVGSLQGLAGTQAERNAAEAARKAASSDLYRQATNATYTVDRELGDLLGRPAVKQAMARAKQLAENNGRPFSFEVAPAAPYSGVGVQPQASQKITGQGLQDLKMAMDEMLTDPASGFTGAAGRTVKDLRGQVLAWMERANPEFKAARTTYADASKPINAMDIGEKLTSRALSNTSDLAGNQRMQANALLSMLRDEPRLIEQATGRKGLGDSLDKILTPEQLKMLRTVASETDRAAAVATAGNGPGSATAQRMASQNVLQRLIGPTGLPSSFAEGALANTVIGKPLNLLYGGVSEPKIQQQLAAAVLDPEVAKAVLAAARQLPRAEQTALRKLLMESARVAPSSATVSGNNN